MGVKVKIVGSDIFTNKKYETVVPGDSTVQVPVVTKKEYQLCIVGFIFVYRWFGFHLCGTRYSLKMNQKSDFTLQYMVM